MTIRHVPNANRIIVSRFFANWDRQQYSVKAFDLEDGEWIQNDDLSSKPFASRDTAVTLPNIHPSSNFVSG
jgi:hypothetical protein